MYLFKILNKMLQHEEEKSIPVVKTTKLEKQKTLSIPVPFVSSAGHQVKTFQSNKEQSKKAYPSKSNTASAQSSSKKTDPNNAYCLFSSDGESLLVMHENIKKTIKLNGISHPDKSSNDSKLANKILNENCKGKSIYLNIIDKKNDILIVDVFMAQDKKISINQLLIDEGLHQSSKLDLVEQDLPVNDMKSTSNISKSLIDANQNNPDHLIGYLKAFGKAPYQNNINNKSSYFITIEKNNVEKTKWGIDLERALINSKAKVGDYISIKKSGTDEKIIQDGNGNTKKSNKNLWIIEFLEDINIRHSKIDGPPVDMNSYIDSDEGYGIQIPDSYPDFYPIDDNHILLDIADLDPMDSILSDLEDSHKKINKIS